MEEPNTFIHRQFSIYEKHLEFLKSINSDNINAALRYVIDDFIKTQNNNKKLKVFKDFSLYVVIAALGLVFFLFGIRSLTFVEMALSYVLGLFMVVFGLAGGVLVALQSSRC